MSLESAISAMRKCVGYYDALQERIGKIKPETIREVYAEKKKGGDKMKAGTIIAIIVAVVALLAAGAAAAVYFSKKNCLLCGDVDDGMYDDFPEDPCCEETPAPEAPAPEETPAE